MICIIKYSTALLRVHPKPRPNLQLLRQTLNILRLSRQIFSNNTYQPILYAYPVQESLSPLLLAVRHIIHK